jgi:hypothetical protein
MKLIAQKDFSWAHRGVEVEHFEAGTEIDTADEDLIEVSMSEGWTVSSDGEAPAPAKRSRARQ